MLFSKICFLNVNIPRLFRRTLTPSCVSFLIKPPDVYSEGIFARRNNAPSFWYQNCFSTSPNKRDVLLTKQLQLKNVLDSNKQRFRNTRKIFKEKSDNIIQDIKDTKVIVKGKVEEIIEKENIYTIPNALCVFRIGVSPVLGYLVVQSEYKIACGLLVVAALTDLVDGWIARTWKSQSSKLGSFLDPMADKVLIATLFLCLTYANLIPWVLTGIVVARDVLLIIAGFMIRYLSLPQPRTLARYFDATHATAQLAPTFISKVNTAVQLMLVGTTLAAPVFDYVDHPALQGLCILTGVTTVLSAISYVVSKNTYSILGKPK